MATYNGVNAAKIAAMKPTNILDPGLAGGKVRCFIDTYVGLGTEANLETIAMGPKLKKGARILDVIIECDTIGGSPDVGDAESSERYISEATDNAVHRLDAVGGVGYEIDETDEDALDSQILILLDAAVTEAGIITLVVFYTVE